jgi:hypothetical protein
MPVWLLIQNDDPGCCNAICIHLFKGFQSQRPAIEEGKPMALLIESAGGDAHMAYRIARMIQRRTSEFTVIVPQYAKSAATLLALGASNLILGRDAELGPLDVQMFDREREDVGSALDAVQSLERLNAFSLSAIDQLMLLMEERTEKKTDTLLPLVFGYPLVKAPTWREFVGQLGRFDVELKQTDFVLRDPVGETEPIRYLERQYGVETYRCVVQPLPDEQRLAPSMIRSICLALQIDLAEFGFDVEGPNPDE